MTSRGPARSAACQESRLRMLLARGPAVPALQSDRHCREQLGDVPSSILLSCCRVRSRVAGTKGREGAGA